MMRAWLYLGVLLVGLCLCGTADAQSTNVPTRPKSQKHNDVSASAFLRARERLRDLFSGFSVIPARQPGTITKVPDPSSPEYFKPFEIRQVVR